MQRIILLTFSIFFVCSAFAQEKTNKRKSKITPLPAISFSPETGLTFGIIGDWDFDLANGDSTVSISKLRGSAVGTTKSQFISEWTYRLFFPEDKFRIFGRTSYKIFPDRLYGQGNDSNLEIKEFTFNEDGSIEENEYNYLNYDIKKIFSENAFLWRIKEGFYIGPSSNIEYAFDYKEIADSIVPLNGATVREVFGPSTLAACDTIYCNTSNRIEGSRFGFGALAFYDSRDDKNNTYKGGFFQLENLNWFGDYSFSSIRFDARYFFPIKSNNQILALQFIQNNRFGKTPLPVLGMSVLGGRDILRGYFQGTFQDNNMSVMQAEYRQNLFANNSGILRRLGFVVFGAAGQVYGANNTYDFKDFHLGAGAGLRININERERTNIRIDYGFGLTPDASIDNSGQRGLYFFLGESF